MATRRINVALALRHAREVREGRPDGSVQLVQQSVQLVQQHVQVNVQNPPVQNGLDEERLQLHVAANQLQQYRDGLELSARQYTESMQNQMREVENMEYLNRQEAIQQVRNFEENLSREAGAQWQRNHEEMQIYTHRCERYVQYEQGEMNKCRSHAEALEQQSRRFDQELRQAEHVLAVNKDKVINTEHAARDAVVRAQKNAASLAELVLTQKAEVVSANQAMHTMEQNHQLAIRYHEQGANQFCHDSKACLGVWVKRPRRAAIP
jgi:hypothetical protein